MERGGRLTLDFLIEVSLTKDEVLERYKTGHQAEADESTALLFASQEAIEEWNFSNNFSVKLAPHCLGSMRLYHMYLKELKKGQTSI